MRRTIFYRTSAAEIGAVVVAAIFISIYRASGPPLSESEIADVIVYLKTI